MSGRTVVAGALLATVMLSGCGPLYRTTYDFTPPRDRIGRLCSAQCATTREVCRGNADNRAQNQYSQCEIEAQQDYYHCLNAAKDSKQRNFCFLRQCYSHTNYSRCDTDYRGCFSACGGRVVAQKHCVLNCPDPDKGDGL